LRVQGLGLTRHNGEDYLENGVWGLGFGGKRLGARVWGWGFGVLALGFEVEGLGFRVEGVGLRV